MLQTLGDLPGRLASALQASPRCPELPAGERAALESLVARSPRGNAYLSLEPGLAVFEHADGVVTWAASGKTAFAVGGVHSAAACTRLLRAFREHVERLGFRQVLLFPVSESERAGVEGADFQCLAVGSEAFLDPSRFALNGGAKADLRQMLNRGRGRNGLRAEEVRTDVSGESIVRIYDAWLAARPAGHRLQLLVGTPRLNEPFSRRYFLARDARAPQALVTLTPGWAGEGYGVDVMARAPDAPAGAMEVAMTSAIQTIGGEGVRRLSLGACPMYEHVRSANASRPALRRLLRWVYSSSVTRRLFAFESLPRFKRKFDPVWETSYIAAWPRVGAWSLYVGCRMCGLFGPRSLRTGLSRAD